MPPMNPVGMAKGGFAGFLQFIREQGVVGLAIGFLLGGAVSKTVTALVTDIVNPILSYVLGTTEGLRTLKFGPLLLGDFVAVVIDFLIIAAVVYFVVKGLGLDRVDVKKT